MDTLERTAPALHRFTTFVGNYARLQSQFVAAHERLKAVVVHKEVESLKLQLSELKGEAFAVGLAGTTVRLQWQPEMMNDSAARGRVTSFEVQNDPMMPLRKVDSISFSRTGECTCKKQPHNDPALLEDDLFDMVLQVFSEIFRGREISGGPAT